MSTASPIVNILHITDLHVGQNEQGLWNGVTRDLLHKDVTRVVMRYGPIDVVTFTGDLSQSAEKDQFQSEGSKESLSRILDGLWPILKASPLHREPILVAVPGNHDLDQTRSLWDAKKDRREKTWAKDLRNAVDIQDAILRGDHSVVGAPDVLAAFTSYQAWWNSCPYRPTNFIKGSLPGDFSWVFVSDEGIRIGFLGLNSAWLDFGEHNAKGKLRISLQQAHCATDGDVGRWAKANDLNFLLTHHPQDWLSPDSQKALKDICHDFRFQAHLCGHLHVPRFEAWSAGFSNSTFHQWQSASLFGLEKVPGPNNSADIDRKIGYTLIRVAFDAHGASCTLAPRIAIKRQNDSWHITADPTFELEDDLLQTPRLYIRQSPLPFQSGSAPAPAPAPAPDSNSINSPAEPVCAINSTWVSSVQDCTLWSNDAKDVDHWRASVVKLTEEWEGHWTSVVEQIGFDPWLDRGFVNRFIARLSELGKRDVLSPAVVAHLLLAPIVRELVHAFARLDIKKSLSEPLTSAGSEAFQSTLIAHPLLARRLEETKHQAPITTFSQIESWLVREAALRHPQLWDDLGPISQYAANSAKEILRPVTQTNIPWGLGSLQRLAALVGRMPSELNHEGGLYDKPEDVVRGEILSLPMLGWRIIAASKLALDISYCDSVAVDTVGSDSSWSPEILIQSVGRTKWTIRESLWRADLLCNHPVQHFLVQSLLRDADDALFSARQHVPEITSHWPIRIDPTGVVPDVRHGRPIFALPHVQFRLDHERVRDLLIGRQLYGNPSLAFRELYQNALDACRHRRARKEFRSRNVGGRKEALWTGSIAFREILENDQLIVECRDNGVGMDLYTLAQIFAVGGKRFRDSDEYRQEQATWAALDPPILFYPNSRFGIGVLSYFMLATSMEVRSRRFRSNGTLGEMLRAHISSASGLFQVSVIEMSPEITSDDWPTDGGTIIRLLGIPASISHTAGKLQTISRISCAQTLQSLLGVAEFETTVDSAPERLILRWGKDSPSFSWDRDGAKFFSIPLNRTGSQLWWVARGNALPVLVDGLATDLERHWILINLKGSDAPDLDVSRNRVIGNNIDDEWVLSAARSSVPALANWERLPLHLLWWLEEVMPVECRYLQTTLNHTNRSISLFPIIASSGSVARLGCFAGDSLIFESVDQDTEQRFWPTRPHLTWTSCSILAWRKHVWNRIRPEEHGDDISLNFDQPPSRGPAFAGDAALLGFGYWTEGKWKISHERHNRHNLDLDWKTSTSIKRTLKIRDLAKRACAAGYDLRSAAARLDAISWLGTRGPSCSWLREETVVDGFILEVLSCCTGTSRPEFDLFSLVQWLFADDSHSLSLLAARSEHLRGLGIGLPSLLDRYERPASDEAWGALEEYFRARFKSFGLVQRVGELSAQSLGLTEQDILSPSVAAVISTRGSHPIQDFVTRLSTFEHLGFRVPPQIGAVTDNEFTNDDICLLSKDFDQMDRWISGEIGMLRVLQSAHFLRSSYADALNRLRRLGWSDVTVHQSVPENVYFSETEWDVLSPFLEKAFCVPEIGPAGYEIDGLVLLGFLGNLTHNREILQFRAALELLRDRGMLIDPKICLTEIPHAWKILEHRHHSSFVARSKNGDYVLSGRGLGAYLADEIVDPSTFVEAYSAFGIPSPHDLKHLPLLDNDMLRLLGPAYVFENARSVFSPHIIARNIIERCQINHKSDIQSVIRRVSSACPENAVIPFPSASDDVAFWTRDVRRCRLLIASLVAVRDVWAGAQESPTNLWAELEHALKWYAWWASDSERAESAISLRQQGWLTPWLDISGLLYDDP